MKKKLLLKSIIRGGGVTLCVLTSCVMLLISNSMYSQGNNWQITGNNNISGNNFLGSTDSSDVVIKTNNIERIRVRADGASIVYDSLRILGPLLLGENTLEFSNNVNISGFGLTDRISSNSNAINFTGRVYTIFPPPNDVSYHSEIKIGIGTQSPAHQLHLHSGMEMSSPQPSFTAYTNTNTGQSTDDGFITGIKTNGTAVINQQEDKNIEFNTGDGANNDTRMIIIGESTNRGNVGIGTTIPNEKLDVNGNIRLSGGNRSIGTWVSHHLYFRTSGAIRMTLSSSGNVGIGTISPTDKLHIKGGSDLIQLERDGIDAKYRFAISDNGRFSIAHVGEGERISISADGNVGIGTTNFLSGSTEIKLAVCGTIRSKEWIVEDFNCWPDFVFNKNYSLMPLNERKNWIFEHSHMPYMKSEAEIQENGAPVFETLKGTVQNVEEIYLYLFEINERLEKIEAENHKLKQENQELKNVLRSISNN
jgi:hypothetical protein